MSFARNNVISMYRHSFLGYRLAGNFRGRKLSRVVGGLYTSPMGENGIVSFARNNVISMYRHSFLGYRIAGNFRGRKLSQIGEKDDFRGENFRELVPFAAPTDAMAPNFAEKSFTKPQNSRVGFLPRKFPAVR